jgi:hypothetical protein
VSRVTSNLSVRGERKELFGFLPIEVTTDLEGAAVRWIRAEVSEFTEPFFEQSVVKLRAEYLMREEVRTPLECLGTEAELLPRVTPKGMIFHISRCGSTLISNALRQSYDVCTLSEAQPCNVLLLPSVIASEGRRRLLRAWVRLFATRSTHSGVVVKANSSGVLSIRFARRVWPRVPLVICVRDPVEVMMSNLVQPSGWMKFMRSPGLAAIMTGQAPETATSMTREEYCARVLGRFCESAIASLDGKCLVVDYEELNSEKIAQIALLFGLGRPNDIGGLEQAFAVYSKDPLAKMAFHRDKDEKRRMATPAMREAAARWVAPHYARLRDEASRLSSPRP